MILAESAAEALVAVFTAAIVIFAFGTALAQAIANRRQLRVSSNRSDATRRNVYRRLAQGLHRKSGGGRARGSLTIAG